MVIRMASGAGSQLSSQHSHSLEGWYAHIPGLKVAVPYTPYDARGLLKTAFRDDNPVIFIEHTALYARKGEVPDEEYAIPFGQAEVHREGKDVTLIGYSGSVYQCARHDRRVRAQDAPRRRRRGRLAVRRLRGRDLGADHGAGVR
jgi:pyruvate dehydrogenase E1 component beta subunit